MRISNPSFLPPVRSGWREISGEGLEGTLGHDSIVILATLAVEDAHRTSGVSAAAPWPQNRVDIPSG